MWSNDAYECQVRYLSEDIGRARRLGPVHLSIKRFDREPIRDWRHLQSVKNEVLGSEREAVELFPAESRLVDAANQTHLWVVPAGTRVECGFTERAVHTQEQSEAEMRRMGLPLGAGRQRPWQAGLSTGPEA